MGANVPSMSGKQFRKGKRWSLVPGRLPTRHFLPTPPLQRAPDDSLTHMFGKKSTDNSHIPIKLLATDAMAGAGDMGDLGLGHKLL